MIPSLVDASAVIAVLAIPANVIWAYVAFGVVFAIGVAAILVRGDWQKARGIERLILFGPVFYAAPLAAFGTEHFTVAEGVASLIPAWIPWHMSAQAGCYEEANAWLQVGMESGATIPPRYWTSGILGRWKAAGCGLSELARQRIS